jgi:hypothetical protein
MAVNNATGDGRNWTLILGAGAALVPLMYFSMPTIVVFFPGMLPTGVAWLCDRTDQKYATFCVGGLNLCGVFPYVMNVWAEGLQIPAAIDIISNIFSLLVMYSAAGFGWMMFLAIPPVVSAFLTVLAQRRVMFLRALQEDIVQEWGPEVSMMDDAADPHPPAKPAG